MDTLLNNKKEGLFTGFQVTGNVLKLIAMVTMLLDHVALGPLTNWILENRPSMSADTYGFY